MFDRHQFFSAPPESSLLYSGHYDLVLVSLSVAVAIFASYAALMVSKHITGSGSLASRRKWILIGGLCLGLGIWAMHFVGMLAFSLPCTSDYDTRITLLSMLPSIGACTLVLKIISQPAINRKQLATAGVLLGLGIGAMHYAGMAAMRLEGMVRYDLRLFLLSLIVAVVLATLAIWIKFRLNFWTPRWHHWIAIISALVMGLAVSGMHYTAMAAAYFIRDGETGISDSTMGASFLASIVLAATCVIIVVTLVSSYTARPNLLSLRHSYGLVSILLMGWVLVAWLSADYYHGFRSDNLYQKELHLAINEADDTASQVNENLQILRDISAMLASNADVRRVLRRFGSQAKPSVLPREVRKQLWTRDATLAELNDVLRNIAIHMKVDVIWVLNAAGDTVASSNFDKSDSFVGSDFSQRQYFQQARNGEPGRQYAVGLVSKLPGLYYSYPLIENGLFFGAVIVKRNISEFTHWLQKSGAFITDANEVIVLAADKQLIFRALPTSTVEQLPADAQQRQYGRMTFEPLKISPEGNQRRPFVMRMEGAAVPIVLVSKSLAEGMISLYVPRPMRELERLDTERYGLFILMTAVGSLLIVAVSAVVMYLRQSRKTRADLRIAATAFESQEAMMITDANSVILRINRAFTDITGYSSEEILGKTPNVLKSGRHAPAFYAAMWESLKRTGAWQGEVWDRRRNGEIYPKWLTITAVKGADAQITHYVGMHADITQRKAAEDEIEHLAFYDPLTLLPNRRLLLDRLHQALATSSRSSKLGALLFIDLDNFKTLNDTRGHDKGDLLLRQVAQRLMVCMRGQDTVARLGGDEFVVMLEGLEANPEEAATQVKTVAEKILAALNVPYLLEEDEHRSTPSIGITLFSDHHDTVDELLRRADLAMYQAKAAGRNTLRFFDPAMQAAVTARALLEAELRDAVRGKQLLLHYQGQVDETGRLFGAEALIRWENPRIGLVSPVQFISLAEETGLIETLGQWVLETACLQLAAWARQPETKHLSLSVNVSPRQFRHPDFVAMVLRALDKSGARPEKLKLEITENLLLDVVEDIITKMTELKVHGVGFSLDDFGTGYSSLSYLKRLPLDQLKIDQSFVRDVFTDVNDAAIVRTIVALAESLGLAVIAEGVETTQQRDFLVKQGCLAFQGYLFGRPGPAEALFAAL